MAKIAFVGTMSVGKSTLVKELTKHPKFKEYKKFTERSKYLRDLGIPLDGKSTLNGQIVFMAERASELNHKHFLADRSIIDVMAFTILSPEINYIHKEKFKELACNLIDQYDFIFYISPKGMELKKNGIRTTDKKYRDELDIQIQNIIRMYDHRIKNLYKIEEMSIEERIKFVINCIENPKRQIL